MGNNIASIILIVVVGLACRYIWKAKKSGKRCIGCSCSGCHCTPSEGGCCSHEAVDADCKTK